MDCNLDPPMMKANIFCSCISVYSVMEGRLPRQRIRKRRAINFFLSFWVGVGRYIQKCLSLWFKSCKCSGQHSVTCWPCLPSTWSKALKYICCSSVLSLALDLVVSSTKHKLKVFTDLLSAFHWKCGRFCSDTNSTAKWTVHHLSLRWPSQAVVFYFQCFFVDKINTDSDIFFSSRISCSIYLDRDPWIRIFFPNCFSHNIAQYATKLILHLMTFWKIDFTIWANWGSFLILKSNKDRKKPLLIVIQWWHELPLFSSKEKFILKSDIHRSIRSPTFRANVSLHQQFSPSSISVLRNPNITSIAAAFLCVRVSCSSDWANISWIISLSLVLMVVTAVTYFQSGCSSKPLSYVHIN